MDRNNIETRQSELTYQQDQTVEGYAVRYNTYDMGSFTEEVLPSALEDIGSQDVRALVNHDPNQLLARSKSGEGSLLLEVDSEGLRYMFSIPDTTLGSDIKAQLERRDITQSSWGFRIEKDKWEYREGKPHHIIEKASPIVDISLVTYPANEQTTATLRSMDAFIKSNQTNKNPEEMKETKIPGAPEIMQRSEKKFNIIKAVNNAINDKHEGLEGELHQEGIKMRKAAGLPTQNHAFYFPFDGDPRNAIETRDQVVGTPNAGGDLVQTILLDYIDYLWPRTPMMENVSRFDNLRDNIDFPREQTVPALAFLTEQQAASTQTSTFDKRSMAPERAGIAMAISNKLLRQEYSNGIQTRLLNQMRNAMAVGIEKAILSGDGVSPNPQGVYTALDGGAQDLTTAFAGALTYDNLVDMETLVVSANVMEQGLMYVTHPQLAGKLKKERTDAGSGIFTVGYSQSLNSNLTANGYRLATTTESPWVDDVTDTYSILFGDMTDIAVGYWGAPSILVNPYTRMKESTVEIYIEQFMDTVVLRDEAFAIANGITL